MKKKCLIAQVSGLLLVMLFIIGCGALSSPATPTSPPTPMSTFTPVPPTAKFTPISPTLTVTPVPPTKAPALLIRLGPGKFEFPLWLEVVAGDYRLTSGTTAREGSTIGVFEDDMTFPPGLAIDVEGGEITLKGTTYPQGTKLLVDSQGNLIQSSNNSSDAALPPQETSFAPYISEAFNNNSNEWSVGDVDGDWWVGTRLIENGVLVWDGISRQAMLSHVIPDRASLKEKFTDMQVSSRAKLLNPTMDGYYGITIRATDENEQLSFYAFLVAGGSYSFLLSADQEYKTLIDWQENPDINKGDWNKLTVQAVGSHFSLFINDNLLAETDDATLPSGQGGVIIGTWQGGEKIQVQFDDFEVRLPTAADTSANTSEPTVTEMPCTDMGWSDIDGSLKYFVAEVRNLEKMKSINVISLSVDINYIQGMIDRVTKVQVATCTQEAKNLVVTGMNAFLTYCQDLSSPSLDQAAIDKAKAQLAEDKLTFIQANTELAALGIKISNLEYLANHFSSQQ